MKIVIPEDVQAESYVLGSCLNSINSLNYCMPQLKESDFFNEDHKILFKIIKQLYASDSEVSSNTVMHALKNCTEKFNLRFLLDICIAFWGSVDFEHYLDIVKNKSALRAVIMASQQAIIDAGKNDARAIQIISQAQNDFLKTQGVGNAESKNYHGIIQNFKEDKNFYDYYMHIQNRKNQGLSPYDGVSSGYSQLDETLGTFQKSALYYIGARTSMGKTTFMCNLIRNMMGKYKVGIFSLEMPATNIIGKIACILADIRYSDYEDGKLSFEKSERLTEIVKSSKTFDILIEDPSVISIQNLSARAKRMRNSGIQILFVDYLTRIQSSGTHTNKHLQVDEVSKGLQTLAKELQIPIICFAQLNRNSTTKERPGLVDFRESGSIEEDADGCLFIHRPSYYDSFKKVGLTELIIAKNRIRGIIKVIDYSCNYEQSEAYFEQERLSVEIEKAKNCFEKEN